jgi:hypothetical protein
VNGLVGLLCTISAAESLDIIDTGEVAGGKANVTVGHSFDLMGFFKKKIKTEVVLE